MANEFTFMFLDIESAMDLYKMGVISKQEFVNKVQRHLDEYPGEPATIEFE